MRQWRSRSSVCIVAILAAAAFAPAASADRANSAVRGFQHGLLSGGSGHNCAVLATAKLRCWGGSGSGELGLDSVAIVGDTAGSMEAAGDAILPADVRSVSAGDKHTCAVLLGGRVRCWGFNFDGQLGADSTATIGAAPGSMAGAADVPLPAGALAVDAGRNHSCALLLTGTVRCWGQGFYGQLGTGDTASVGDAPGDMASATDVPLPRAATAITAGDAHTCALLEDGAVRCWGEGGSGQLGNDATTRIGDAPGEVAAAGDVPLPGPAVALTAGGQHTCALLATGKIRCWGYNWLGSLGINTSTDVGKTPGSMAGAADAILPADAISVSAGGAHTCAVLVTLKLRCWGSGMRGQLGNGQTGDIGNSMTEMEGAADVPLPVDVVAVSTGSTTTCALMTSGKLRCWGQGDEGRLGTNTTNYVGDGTVAVATAPDVILPADLHARVADVSLQAAAAPAVTVSGATTTVTVTVTNAGADTVDGVVVAAPVPSGTTLVSAAPGAGAYDAAGWTVGTLAPGASASLALTVSTPAGSHAATYEVASAGRFDPDSTPGNALVGEDDQAAVTITTTAAPGTPTPTTPTNPATLDRTAPAIASATLSRRTFARTAGRRRRPTSTRLTVRVSEPATLRLVVQRLDPGRRSGARCVKPTRRNRSARRCTRAVRTSSRSVAVKGTTVVVTLTRRIGGAKPKAGRYRITLTAADAAGNLGRSRTVTVTLI